MKPLLRDLRIRCVCLVAIACLLAGFVCPGHARGEDTSGMALNVYTDPSHQGTDYTLGAPVKLIMVIKNISGWPVNTDRGFSQIELQRSLVVTDPGGKRYSLSQETLALTPGPPIYFYNRATSPAETLRDGWVRSVTIGDLTEIFPMMRKTPGWYTIEANQPFVRYAWTIQDDQLGKLAVQDDPRNWYGTIDSNRVQVNIVPELGGNPRVRVLDSRQQPPVPIAQVPVKVVNGTIAQDGLADAWANAAAVLSGTTDQEGWAIWDSGAPCVQKADYTAIAFHQGQYREAFFESEAAWASGCSVSLEKQILFERTPAANTFSVFGLKSVIIKSEATVLSGNIGVIWESGMIEDQTEDLVEITIGEKVEAKTGVQIFADTVKIDERATVYDVFCNTVIIGEKVTILGIKKFPLELAVVTALPSYRNVSPGDVSVVVNAKKSQTLAPGSYGDLIVNERGKVRLSGGVYHFSNIVLSEKSSVLCLKPCEIRIQGNLTAQLNAYVGPEIGSELSARDVFLYVNGKDVNEEAVVKVGKKNEIQANIFAPNGTLWIGEESIARGSFIAEKVIVGERAEIDFNSTF